MYCSFWTYLTTHHISSEHNCLPLRLLYGCSSNILFSYLLSVYKVHVHKEYLIVNITTRLVSSNQTILKNGIHWWCQSSQPQQVFQSSKSQAASIGNASVSSNALPLPCSRCLSPLVITPAWVLMDSYIAPCSSLLSHHSRPHIQNHQPKSSMCVPIFCLVLQSQQLLESCRLVSSSSHYQQHLSFFDTGENDTHHIHSLLLFIAAGSLSSSLSAVSAFLVFLVYRRPVVVVLTFFRNLCFTISIVNAAVALLEDMVCKAMSKWPLYNEWSSDKQTTRGEKWSSLKSMHK